MIHIFRKSLHIAASPGKLVTHPLKKVFHRHYAEKRFARTLFVVDLIVLASITVSVALILTFTVFRPAKIVNLVHIDATVAPTNVVSGGLSTLVFRYENTSQEELRFARLNLGFPAHFEVKEVLTDLTEVAPHTYDLGTIPAGTNGSIKIAGVMFGDVGGEQLFQSTLSFVYGPNDRTANKFIEHAFSPTNSTIHIELVLPDRLIVGQQVEGEILATYDGDSASPVMITIKPEWPEGFILNPNATFIPIDGGIFAFSGLEPGQTGVIDFSGSLPNTSTADFIFHPYFTFGDTSYKQETLKQTVTLLPSQLQTTTTFNTTSINPGSPLSATINYQHTGELPITNVVLRLASDSSIFKSSTVASATIAQINPGESGSVNLILPTNYYLNTNGLVSFTNVSATVRTRTDYTLPDGIDQNISLTTSTESLPITTPVVLESFGRYASPQGDQIGRGPLPPLVGEETKYWVFLTLRGTTNTLENVVLDADLGSGVQFTGKQSVSAGESLNYYPESNSIQWTIGSIEPTLGNSEVVSVAFEVALTPSAQMIGTTPTLISGPIIRGRDAFTGTQVVGRGSTITTNLPYDSMAAGLGVVEE